MPRTHSWIVFALGGWFWLLGADDALAQAKQGKPLTGIEAARYANSTGQQGKAEQFALKLLWDDIRQPECLDILARAVEIQRRNEEAAVWNALLLRVLEEKAAPADVAKYKAQAERRLTSLNKDFETQKTRYAAAAAGKKFESPEKVDDLWMTQVRADLNSLHNLYAWKLVGGRKDGKSDWVHNTQGAMHRSGLKYVDEVDGRSGVLFGVPMKASADAAKKLGHPTQVKMSNSGKCAFLRIGVKGYNFPFVLKVFVGGKEVFAQTIGEKAWADLKIDLKDAAGKPDEVTIELSVPEDQRWAEGAWLDYLDFFEN